MILEQVHKPQNALMHAKMQEKLLSQLIPFFVKIIEDGISQNLMQTDYPEDTLHMLLSIPKPAVWFLWLAVPDI